MKGNFINPLFLVIIIVELEPISGKNTGQAAGLKHIQTLIHS